MENTETDGTQSHFMRIPPEVRWPILKKLGQTVAMKARLICRQIRDEIDDSYKVSIVVNDGISAWTTIGYRLSQLYIKEIIIVEQTKTPHFLSENGRRCVETVEIRGPICKENLDCYMFSYIRLKKFILNYDLPLFQEQEPVLGQQNSQEEEQSSHSPVMKRQLGFQKSLEILILKGRVVRYGQNEDYLTKEYSSLSNFLRFTFPQIKEFEMTLRVAMKNWAEAEHLLLDFIQRHSSTLKKTMLTIFQFPLLTNPPKFSSSLPCSETFSPVNSTRRNFKCLQLKTFVLNLSHVIKNISEILNSVTNVERFNGNIHNQTSSLYYTLIHNNYRTLKILKLARLSTSKLTPFNCSILSECIQLEQLALDNEYLFHLTCEWNSLTYPEIVELECLPKTLRLIEIFWFRIKSHSIRKMLVNLTNLKHLILRYVGSQNNLGVTPSILKELMLKNSTMYYFSITNVNITLENEKDILNEIMDVYKDEYDAVSNSFTHRSRL